ncbi:carbon-nitrogen hydrolase family protein, partial [Endozoicomonas sp. ISHI1]|uniref:carbon-nitrogen hydrolase family protein n=1 Tax=Endozoicomonas sp. ISHI1 TaxID=2825882 RepID=UPI002147882F
SKLHQLLYRLEAFKYQRLCASISSARKLLILCIIHHLPLRVGCHANKLLVSPLKGLGRRRAAPHSMALYFKGEYVQNFKIAVAQVPSKDGEIDKNIEMHMRAISLAHKNAVSIIIFPELSLTGYDLEIASKQALTIDDKRLSTFHKAAIENDIFVVVGAPLIKIKEPEIGSIIFAPNGEISSYSKIHLHSGECKYFKPGKNYKIIEVQNQKVALAICADTNNPDHASACANAGATVYAAGVLFTENGYIPDTDMLASYAKKHEMLVTIANHNQNTGSWEPTGKSASWSSKGLLSKSSEQANSLVISQQINSEWVSEVFEI